MSTYLSHDQQAATTMRAIARDAYGAPSVLDVRDLPKPVAAQGEVLLRVQAAGIDRGAVHLMTGTPYAMRLAGFGVRRPKQPGLGMEVAGVVEAVGAGVEGLAVGDAVFGVGRATFAQYATAKPGQLATAPSAVGPEQAAAVGISGVTALQALRTQGRLQPGQTVLVIGASGGVGSFAVQIAKAFGAHVTGVARTDKLDFVRSLGADDVLDHTAGPLEATGRRYDLVLDIGGHRPLRTLRRLLTPTGRLVFVGSEGVGPLTGGMGRQLRALLASPFTRQSLGSIWVSLTKTADLDTLRKMIDSGTVVPAVHRVCTLAEVPAVLADLQAGAVRGKAVVGL